MNNLWKSTKAFLPFYARRKAATSTFGHESSLWEAVKQANWLPPKAPRVSFLRHPLRYVMYYVKNSVPVKHPELSPLFVLIMFDTVLAGSAILWALRKEDVYLNHRSKLAPYEKWDHEHRYNLLPPKHRHLPPPEVDDLRHELGRYKLHD